MSVSELLDPPVIETEPVVEIYITRPIRVDRIGSSVSVLLGQHRIDPNINGGKPYCTPVARVFWLMEDLERCRGTLRDWFDGGAPEGSTSIPFRGRARQRELM
jgi:hypothetical protein